MPRAIFEGKVAVVTGATSGIGEAVAERLLDEGARVVGLGRSGRKLAEATARWGERFVGLEADLSSRSSRRAAFARLPGRVDILINNAGICGYETPLGTDDDFYAELLEVNVLAAIELTRHLAPALSVDAHVVNVSSVTARFVAHPRFAAYGMSKSALERFTECLRLELAPRGVKVSLIAPGLVDTPIYDKVAGFEQTRAALHKSVPVWLSASDVADALLWMLSRPPSVVVSELVLLPRHQAR